MSALCTAKSALSPPQQVLECPAAVLFRAFARTLLFGHRRPMPAGHHVAQPRRARRRVFVVVLEVLGVLYDPRERLAVLELALQRASTPLPVHGGTP